MVYLKVILDDRKAKQGKHYPIVVRITYNRKATTFSTGIRVEKEYWDKYSSRILPNHPNQLRLNASISEYFLKIQKITLDLEGSESFSVEELKIRLAEKSKPAESRSSITFNVYSETLISEMLSVNRSGNAIIYQTASNRLIKYLGNKPLKFKEIDYNLLEGFRLALYKDGVKPNTVSNYFRTIRAIYNKAIKAKLVDRSYYPFQDISIKSERTTKRSIAISDLKLIYNLNLKPSSREWHARNYFFLSFSLIGISFTDLAYLKPSNISKGRLTYRRRKTHKEYNIKLSALAKEIFNHYHGSNSKYLLPILAPSIVEDSLDAKKKIFQWIKTTNKWIGKLGEKCDIRDNLTTYVARHTWATTAKRLGYSNELIAEAMGHEYGNRITNIYLDNFEQSVIDDLNERVQSSL